MVLGISCKSAQEHDAAPDFVARFNLQELLVATDDS
jgi:hypothetical protein